MAGEYLETTVNGSAYIRARKVVIDYKLDQLPVATFIRERVMTLGNEIVKTPMSTVKGVYDEAAEIPLRDPETGQLTGDTMIQGQIFLALYSLFYQLSVEEDS